MAGSHAATLRRTRERDLVAATRALFDERGMQDAPIEEIARAVGIARGLIYRHFSSKEELFVLTVTDYLRELDAVLAASVDEDGGAGPVAELESMTRAYATFCARYPAFLDCALSLMHRPAGELRAELSESVWLRLGQGMARCVNHVCGVLERGAAAGAFAIDDPAYAANVLWTQTLGTMHLARIRVGLRQAAPGIPELFPIEVERVIESCVRGALGAVTAAP